MKTRTFLLSALLVVLYLLCWAPYNIVAILNIERSDEGPMHWVYYFHHLIGVNSALNPLIYGMPWRQKFSIRGRRLSRQKQVFNQIKNDQKFNQENLSQNHLAINGIPVECRSRSSTTGTIYDRTSIIEESSQFAKSPKQSVQNLLGVNLPVQNLAGVNLPVQNLPAISITVIAQTEFCSQPTQISILDSSVIL